MTQGGEAGLGLQAAGVGELRLARAPVRGEQVGQRRCGRGRLPGSPQLGSRVGGSPPPS